MTDTDHTDTDPHVVRREVLTPRALDALTPSQRTRLCERLLTDPRTRRVALELLAEVRAGRAAP